MEPIWAVGLMTGTVLDGNIDVALLRTDGERVADFGAYRLAPYPPGLLELLQRTLEAARAWNFTGPEPAIFMEAEEALTRAQAEAVRELVETRGPGLDRLGIVGFHGQTVLHRAPAPGLPGRTRQLGDGQLMADLLRVPVAFDFRSADVVAGGQGAPLSAIYHAGLLRAAGFGADTAVLNLGGVANVTWAGEGDEVVAFDTGPANAPLNDFVRRHQGGEMDRGGALALAGRVDEDRLARLLTHPYLEKPYPKSLDRFDFSADMAEGLPLEDGAALLTAFTASSVGKGLDLLPRRPGRLVVCGGGRHNPAIMAALEARAGVAALPAEAAGWRGDAVEAECFAFLAVRVLRGLPISFPSTTGAPRPLTGGRLVWPGPLAGAATETASPRFAGSDDWPAADLVRAMTGGQFEAIAAVQAAGPALARAVEEAGARLDRGGRLIYMGAGTSGRVAVQDAAELYPTFGWPRERALTLMAGGPDALVQAREGAEDDTEEAIEALEGVGLRPEDVVVAVAASGSTPFALSGLRHARARGALTIGIYNNPGASMGALAELPVLLATGAEFLAGSTRMQAGTAQKAVLNILSTGVMVHLGLIWRGQMVAMRPSNVKLRRRAVRMVAGLADAAPQAAEAALLETGWDIRLALLMLLRGLSVEAARTVLDARGGNLRRAMREGA